MSETIDVLPPLVDGEVTKDDSQQPPVDGGMDDEVVVPTTDPAVVLPKGAMAIGDVRFGITCTGSPVGTRHWLADSSACGDMVMSLPSSVLVAGRSKESGGVAVDMVDFLDSVIEGAAKLEGLPGVAAAASLPGWAVSRLFGTFPALMDVYHEALDQAVLIVEASAMKAAIGMKVQHKRTLRKSKSGPLGVTSERSSETLDKTIAPDATLSKMILTSRMKSRYKDEGGVRQAIQINISGGEARL